MEDIKEVTILTDWICDGVNQKGKTGNWNIEYLKLIKIEYEIHNKGKQNIRKLQSESDSIPK
jgi:hypothetical protein